MYILYCIYVFIVRRLSVNASARNVVTVLSYHAIGVLSTSRFYRRHY